MIHREKLPSLLALAVGSERAGNGALPDTSGKVRGTAAAPTTRVPIAEYRQVLGRLWPLNTPDARPSAGAHDSDAADARRLLAEQQAPLCDELGADLAVLVSQQAARRG